jgi:hypothetical protein
MDSIWQNAFYETPPAIAWTYKISFNSFKGVDKNSADILNSAIVDINVGKRESQYVSVFYGGVEFKKFTRANTTGEISVKFNEDENYTITKIIESIYENYNMNQNYPTSTDSDALAYNSGGKDYKIDENIIEVQVYKNSELDAEEPEVTYSFYGCKIVSLDDIQFSYDSTEAITRSVHFTYDYMKFKKNEKKES